MACYAANAKIGSIFIEEKMVGRLGLAKKQGKNIIGSTSVIRRKNSQNKINLALMRL